MHDTCRVPHAVIITSAPRPCQPPIWGVAHGYAHHLTTSFPSLRWHASLTSLPGRRRTSTMRTVLHPLSHHESQPRPRAAMTSPAWQLRRRSLGELQLALRHSRHGPPPRSLTTSYRSDRRSRRGLRLLCHHPAAHQSHLGQARHRPMSTSSPPPARRRRRRHTMSVRTEHPRPPRIPVVFAGSPFIP